MEETTPTSRSSEWTKFIVLVVILLGTILVVALIRPLIFKRVVPAILGEGQQVAPVVDEIDSPPVGDEETADEPVEEEETAVDGTESTSNTTEDDAATSDDTEGENPGATVDDIDPESLPESVATIEHIVQPGDTLTALARNYKVSISEIMAANKLSNPDRLAVGSKLLIPQPE